MRGSRVYSIPVSSVSLTYVCPPDVCGNRYPLEEGMIPEKITSDHVAQAIQSLRGKRNWAPRASIKYCVEVENGDHFPPRLVLSVAGRFAPGAELEPERFNGGAESNDFFQLR